jgi:RNA polymerase sigma-70 factor (ECF subfamily)
VSAARSEPTSPSGAGADESSIVDAARRGDPAAFDQLVLRHQRRAYVLALWLLGDAAEASDVTQEAFLRAWRGLRVHGPAKFSTRLFSIIVHASRRQWRWPAPRRSAAASLDALNALDDWHLLLDPEDPSPEPGASAAHAELLRHLADAVARLDHAHRAVIVLRDVQGLSFEEVAEVAGCGVGTVTSRLSRARWRLRALLDGRL